ncbi:MAG TPA: amidohydrolase [Mucilaginibacter sp.]|jgi:amidohydrolase|nr:amidohydrolase [Mucilaginibacter sp.]
MKKLATLVFSVIALQAFAQSVDLKVIVARKADSMFKQTVAWRRDFHEHPELGNREVRTAGIVADYLKSLGMDVKTGIATTGVVAILKGGHPGPVVALRSELDALPVTERTPVPFASKVTTTYNGQTVGVMHACGHDSHMAMLLTAATILSSMKNELHGTVKFIFQPAEEGVPAGEKGGAEEMVKEGVLENPRVDVIFAQHIFSYMPAGTITYRPGGAMASVNDMKIIIKGKSSHGAEPWFSVDPIVTSAQIINNLQTIVSRNINLKENPAVVTIGAINGGNRHNIIPDKVEMLGTLRAFSDADEQTLIARVKKIVNSTADANGATAEVYIPYSVHYPVTYNDRALTAQMLPTLQQTAGKDNVIPGSPLTVSEDMSFFQQKVPGLDVFLGGMPKGSDPKNVASNHSPDFYIDESVFPLGVKTLCNLTLDYMNEKIK